MSDHDEAVRRRFAADADYYVQSATHAAGPDLPWMLKALAPRPEDLALDVATGTGHAALALARVAHRVVALDLTAEMLAKGRRLAAERGIANVVWVEGSVEALPFPSGLFDLSVCRIAAHHFSDPAAAMAEMARVLAPGGRLALIDNVVPEDEGAAAWINAFEQLRDPTHVCALTAGAWQEHLRSAGLEPRLIRIWDSPLDVRVWGGSAPDPEAVAARLAAAPSAARDWLQVDGPRFAFKKALITARRT